MMGTHTAAVPRLVYGHGYMGTGTTAPARHGQRTRRRIHGPKTAHQATMRIETEIATHFGQKITNLVVNLPIYLVKTTLPGPK